MDKTIQVSHIKQLRSIAMEFQTEQLTKCLDEVIAGHKNSCGLYGEKTELINTLARAGVVKQLVNDGASYAEAIRELGKRMRSFINA